MNRRGHQQHRQHARHPGQPAAVPAPGRRRGCCATIRKSSWPAPRRSPTGRRKPAAWACTTAEYSFCGTIRYRVPREDWCSVERITPTIISGTEMNLSQLERLVPSQPFEHRGREFQRQHRGVERHAPGHFEHHRVRIPHHQRMPDAVRAGPGRTAAPTPPARSPETRSGWPAAGSACSVSILKMWTIATSVNPPAARPTPHSMSKPIQMPQGNWSLRLVTPPSPYRTRR